MNYPIPGSEWLHVESGIEHVICDVFQDGRIATWSTNVEGAGWSWLGDLDSFKETFAPAAGV